MTINAAEVSVAKPLLTSGAGPIYVAPIGTTVPTDATADLAEAFVGLGYVAEAGWSENSNRETADIKAWGGDTVLKPVTSYDETYSFGLLQTNKAVLEFVYGKANVTVTGDNIAVLHNAKDLPHQVIVIETAMSDGRIKRKVIPDGQITEMGELNHVDGDAITYQVTVSAFPDANKNYSADYYAKPVAP